MILLKNRLPDGNTLFYRKGSGDSQDPSFSILPIKGGETVEIDESTLENGVIEIMAVRVDANAQ